MRITSVDLKNFRCFGARRVELDAPLVLLTGSNGVGKTSLLEALHYACYLRSFKTHAPKELVAITQPGFAVNITLSDTYSFDALAVTLEGSKRSLKLNQKPVSSYKELYDLYKVVTMTEEDLDVVKGAPSVRRSYIDQIMMMFDPHMIGVLRKYRTVLDNRNALLNSFDGNQDSYDLWTNQLLQLASLIKEKRKSLLEKLSSYVDELTSQVLGSQYNIELKYVDGRPYTIGHIETCEQLQEKYPRLQGHELSQRRSLIGSHLDDIAILFEDKYSRMFASRGQQKLIVFLLKLAQLRLFNTANEPKAIFLIDDFMADFDESRMTSLLMLIRQFATQVIITSPADNGFLKEQLLVQGALHIQL